MRIVGALVGIALGLSGSLLAAEAGRKTQSNTQHVDFPAGGVLHITNSTGELTVEGWDGPDVVMVTTKSIFDAQGQKAAHEFDEVQVKAERRDNEVIVSTSLPRHRSFPHRSPWATVTAVAVDCRIKVPRNARLVVDHGEGEVHVSGLTGDIQVTTGKGDITLQLPPDGVYAIDAKTKLGDVVSDFPGTDHRRKWLFAHRFVQEGATSAHKLTLRVGWGDILVVKPWTPPAASPTN